MQKIAFILTIIMPVLQARGQVDVNPLREAESDAQIGQYIVELFEDSRGNLWIGTLSKGVARYDGKSLRYFTTADGLISNAVVSVVEDDAGILWFGTQEGLSRFDGESFTNYTVKDGLPHFRVSGLMIDRQDNLWISTWGGVGQFDGKKFCTIPLPKPDVELLPYQTTMDWVTELMEDREGNIWIGRDGYGASKFDGKHFTHITEKEGLPSNNMHAIVEDRNGHIWLGTRIVERDHPDPDKRKGEGGLTRFDGEKMAYFPDLPGLHHADIYFIYNDSKGRIWVSTVGEGVYRFDGESVTNFNLRADTSGIPFKGVQQILEDSHGTMWFGCSGGLFRLEGEQILNVKQNGPWP
ncbi:MAG: two-component regulator propeller domain-containing protein [Bacteroidota bacterium]